MTRVLLFGGSFDPPHLGHIEVPYAAMKFLSFDHVLYMPVFQSPLKGKPKVDTHHRLAMLQLALADCPWASISTLELDRGGTSYTIATINALLGEYDELRLLIGVDQWAQFQKWHCWEEIIKLANPAIMPREGFSDQDASVLQIPALPSASTSVRKQVESGLKIEGLVHPEVAQYIAQHQLYL
jgi:nicotinate-nucleotide adenylyltransferase